MCSYASILLRAQAAAEQAATEVAKQISFERYPFAGPVFPIGGSTPPPSGSCTSGTDVQRGGLRIDVAERKLETVIALLERAELKLQEVLSRLDTVERVLPCWRRCLEPELGLTAR